MSINKTYEPGVHPGTLRDVYRVDGDSPYRTHPTEEAAKEREAELAAAKTGLRGPTATA